MEGKVEATAEVADQTTVISPSKPSLPSIVGDQWIEGLKLIGVVNGKNVITVPSMKNYVDDSIQFRTAIIDTGCSSYLIRVDSTSDFLAILNKYQDQNKYDMALDEYIGVGGKSQTLIVTTAGQRGFELVLAADLFEKSPVHVSTLRLQLCSEDARVALNFPGIERLLLRKDLETLREYSLEEVPRIPVSLIGNLVLGNAVCVLHRRVFYLIDADHCDSVSFPALGRLSRSILEQLDPDVREMIDKVAFSFTKAGDVHSDDADYDF
jgi:predicted aspartyl protease